MAIDEALMAVRKTGDLSIPLHLRNAPTQLMKDLNYGKDYKYAHSFKGNFVEQQYLPDEIENIVFYKPQNNSQEAKILEKLTMWWKNRKKY
jgi:putative ATPase